MKCFVRITLLLFFFASVYQSTAQEMDPAMMEAWQAYMTPGEKHQLLAKADGKWNEDVTFWLAPKAEAISSKSTAENRMIMGGRYQESLHYGDMMGMPFEGRSVTGYDNAAKKFVSSWIDNMGTSIMYMEGKWDEASKTIMFTGEMADPITGKNKKIRQNYTYVDDNTHMLEMFDTLPNGEEYKSMLIKLTRM